MNEIVTRSQRLSELIGENSHASREQTVGIGEVHQAVAQLDQVTQQNPTLVEQSAAAAAQRDGLRRDGRCDHVLD